MTGETVPKPQAEKVNQTSGQSSTGRLQKLNYYGSEAGAATGQVKDNVKQHLKRKPEATKTTHDDTFDIPVEHEETPVTKKRGRPKKNEATVTSSIKQKATTTSRAAKVDSQAVKGKNKSRSKQKAAEADPDDDFIGSTKAVMAEPNVERTTVTRATRSKQPTARPDTARQPQQAQLQTQQRTTVEHEDQDRSNVSDSNHDSESYAQFESEMVDLGEDEHENEQEDEHEDQPRKQNEPSQYSLAMRLDATRGDLDTSILHQDENDAIVEHPVSERTRKMPPPKVPQHKTPVAVMSDSTKPMQQAKTISPELTQIKPVDKTRKVSLVPFDASGPRIQGTIKTGKSSEDPSVQQDFSIANRSGIKQLVMASPKLFSPHESAATQDVQSLLETMNPLHKDTPRDEQSRAANVSNGNASELEAHGHEGPDSPLSANTEKTSPPVSHSRGDRLSNITEELIDLGTKAKQSLKSYQDTVSTGQDEPVQSVVETTREHNHDDVEYQDQGFADLMTATTTDIAHMSSPDDDRIGTFKRVTADGSPLPTRIAPRSETSTSAIAKTRLNEAVADHEAKKVHFVSVVAANEHGAGQQIFMDSLEERFAEKEDVPHIEVARGRRRTAHKEPDQAAIHVDMPKEKDVLPAKKGVIADQASALALVPSQKAHNVPETETARTLKPIQFNKLPSADKARSVASSKAQEKTLNSFRKSPEKSLKATSGQALKEDATRNMMRILRSESPDDQIIVPTKKSIGEQFEDDTEQEEEGDADVQMLDDDDSDPEKTLVNEDEVDDQSSGSESGASEVSDSEQGSETMQTPSQDNDVEKDQWRAALAGHQARLFDSLVEISHQLVRNLVDKETAVGDILSDYRRDGFRLIEQLKLDHLRQVKEWQNQIKQADSELRTNLEASHGRLSNYIRHLPQTRKQTSKRDMSAINRQFNTLLQSK